MMIMASLAVSISYGNRLLPAYFLLCTDGATSFIAPHLQIF